MLFTRVVIYILIVDYCKEAASKSARMGVEAANADDSCDGGVGCVAASQ